MVVSPWIACVVCRNWQGIEGMSVPLCLLGVVEITNAGQCRLIVSPFDCQGLERDAVVEVAGQKFEPLAGHC